MSLTYLRRPIRICLMRSPKSSPTFGSSTIMRGLDGRYLSRHGLQVQDRIHLIYTDTPFAFEEHVESLSRYADALKDAAFEALEEEAILVVVLKIYHAE
jgi:hypothetical protein